MFTDTESVKCGPGSLVAKGVSSSSPLWREGVCLKFHWNNSLVTPADSRIAVNIPALEAGRCTHCPF